MRAGLTFVNIQECPTFFSSNVGFTYTQGKKKTFELDSNRGRLALQAVALTNRRWLLWQILLYFFLLPCLALTLVSPLDGMARN